MSFAIPDTINELDRLQAAQFYHDQLGWAVHPLMPPDRGDEQERGKKPLLKGWRNHRAGEVTQDFMRRHFNGTSHTNVGCVVRPPFIHVDLDSKPDAGESVRVWLAAQPALATVPRERTGGGAHLTFVCRDLPEPVLKSKKAVTCQINERVSAELYFDGLNIVLSPSVHKSGHRYVWETTGIIPEVSWEQLRNWFGFKLPMSAKRGRPKKEAPWWAGFNGDLSTLDIINLFRQSGRLGDCIDPDEDKWAVRCPWEHEHSKLNDSIGTDTAIFASEPPGFRCLHAHCAERTVQDLCQWFEQHQPGLVDKCCRVQRVWQTGQTDREGRPRIELPGLDREDSEFANEVAQIIAPRQVWFNKAERVVAVRLLRFSETSQSLGFQAVEPIEARTAIEDYLQTGIVQMDRDSGQPVFSARTMTRECAAGLLAAPQLRRRLPEIIRILDFPLPVRLPAGDIARPEPGYDARFRIYTDPATPELRRMSRDEALEWIRLAHIGFGFRDEQSLVHALARMLTPYCRGLMGWDGRFPLWHFSGNRPRAGKDYLAGVTQIIYEGRSIEDAPLERESEETRKRITAALMSGRRMLHFANCQGHIQDAAFIGAITSKTFGARNLGSTEAKSDLTLPNEIEFSLSANIGLTFRPDVEPRTRRITLEFPDDNSNGRNFPNPELHDWVRRHRADLLSAIDSLVALWIEGGCPPGKRPFNSFPEWGLVVGGIMTFHGLGDPCEPHLDDGGLPADRQTEAMRALFVIGYAAFPDKWINKAEIYEIIETNAETEAFSWFGDLAEKGAKTRVGKDLRQFKERELDGVVMLIDDHADKSQQHRYQFTKRSSARRNVLGDLFSRLLPGSGGPDTDSTDSSNGHIGHFGHFVALPIPGGNKCEEKNKNRENKKSVRTGRGEDVPNLPEVPKGRVITRGADLPAIAAVIRSAGSVALDLETYGPRKSDGLDPWAGDIRLLSLRVRGEAPWLLDLRSIGYDLGELKLALESVEIIAHNAKFDLLWLRHKVGLRASRVFCTLVAARLLSAGTKPGNDLDKCLDRYLGIEPAPDHSLSDWGSMFLGEDQLAYAARDVDYLHDLADKLWGDLEHERLDVVGRLEFELVPVIVEMEAAGIAVDQAKLREIETRAKANAAEHAALLRNKLGDPRLNPGSPQQLREGLARYGIQVENTNEETLKAADDGDLILLILEFRGAEKIAQQARSLLDCARGDGRIHGRFDPTGTATGRFSSKDPNLQNVGRGELRSCFVPALGHKLIVADYSQIELRAAAAIAGETKMIEAYRNGVDLHKQTAAEVLGKRADTVTKEDRQMAKAANFGLLYGQSAPGLVRYAAASYSIHLEMEQAEQIRRQFFRTYGHLRQWHGLSRNQADAGAREVRTILDRRRLIPETASEWERFTALVNTPVQGSCADGMKRALVLLASRLPREARLLSTVHDEVIVEAPEMMADEVCSLVRETLIEAMAALFPQVPIEVEAGVCSNWGEK
ncbi:MAG: bifunctional DNA primase/polymerase [Verrucomicrobiaceae bacterium]|nr:bifunctional DNA primase/polymerase [Verrucomicrobiaceae bacterium]